MPDSGKLKGYLALLITSVVWGTTWVVSKIGVQHIEPLQMAYIRQFIAGAAFVLFYMVYRKFSLPSLKQFRWLAIMSVIMFVSANGLSTWSIRFIPAGLSALIGALYPLSVVILEKIFFKSKKLTALTFIGLLLGITGIAIVFYEHAFAEAGPDFLIGVLLSATAMLSWSVGTIFIARNKMEINPYYGLGWQMLISSVLLFFIANATQKILPFSEIPATVWWVIGYLVVFGSIVAFIAFIYSMKKLSPSLASLYAYINPLIAMILANIIMNEPLSWNTVLGAMITLTGIFLVNYSMKKTAPVTEAEI